MESEAQEREPEATAAQELLFALNPQVIGTWRAQDVVKQYGWGNDLYADCPEIKELLDRAEKLVCADRATSVPDETAESAFLKLRARFPTRRIEIDPPGPDEEQPEWAVCVGKKVYDGDTLDNALRSALAAKGE